MKNELLEKNTAPRATALINRPTRQARTPAPEVFRRQETFWKTVRERIVAKDPTFREVLDRLY